MTTERDSEDSFNPHEDASADLTAEKESGDRTDWQAAIFAGRAVDVTTKVAAVVISTLVLLSLFEFWLPWFDVVYQYRFHLTVLLVVVGLALLLRKEIRWAAICLVLSIPTIVVAIALYIPDTHAPNGVTQPVRRIMFLNLFHGNRQLDEVLKLIEREDPDVICFVEITKRIVKRVEILKESYPHSGIDPNYRGVGARIYSKFELVQDSNLATAPRVTDIAVVRAEIHFPEQTATLIVSHPNSPITTDRIFTRNQQIREIAELVQKETLPVICCGDFNCTSWSYQIRNFLNSTRLKDTRKGFGIQPSWPSINSGYLVRIPIDHVFVDRQIAIVNRRLSERVGSDHFAVIVDFEFQ